MKRAWRWYKQFKETGNVERIHSTGQPRRFDEDVDRVKTGFNMESKEVNFPNKYRVTDATSDCPQNSLEEPTSKAIKITGNPETYSM
jgi:hypothetical protein